jgi:hypothetical protein
MSDLGRLSIFIGIMFITLFSISFVSSFYDSVLQPYEPIQLVFPSKNHKKPYVMVTKSDDYSDFYYVEPRYKVVDYGTYHEIDSLKCIRYKQMQWKMYYLDKLREKSCK